MGNTVGIKRLIFRGCVRGIEKIFLLRNVKRLYHSNLTIIPNDTNNYCIDVVTIAFNNAKIIELHNRYVRKYLKGNITHIVVDNSTNIEESAKIRTLCENDMVGYVKLHKNRMDVFSGSYSHAAAVQWTYQHIIKPRGAWGFAFIDHDIFTVCEIDIAEILKLQPVYGALRKRNGMWYLSAIISFFRSDFVLKNGFDFMPVTFNGTYLDSGGGNWVTLYRSLNESGLKFMSNYTKNYKDGDNRHQDQIELFDDEKWVHTINGSYWKKVAVVKENIMSDLLSQYEK